MGDKKTFNCFTTAQKIYGAVPYFFVVRLAFLKKAFFICGIISPIFLQSL
jgi:hypothetical protein